MDWVAEFFVTCLTAICFITGVTGFVVVCAELIAGDDEVEAGLMGTFILFPRNKW